VTTLIRLGQEYVFMAVIATFLRAVRAGAIHLQHGAVLLAHYGRLGPAFDACSKVIVDLLKEETVRDPNGEMVAGIVTRAIREVRDWNFMSDLF
jgi:cohesin complex subunit SA-1/2